MNLLFQKQRTIVKLPKHSRYLFLQSLLRRNLHEQEHSVKPHQEIPEIKGLPLVGTLLDYLRMRKGTSQLDICADRVHMVQYLECVFRLLAKLLSRRAQKIL